MITTAQLQILQHALGLDQYGCGDPYRNRFVTGESGSDHVGCLALVEAGLMIVMGGNELTGGDDLFFVTSDGKQYVADHSPKRPKLSRSKQRYQEYLNSANLYDGGFGEYLRCMQFERKRVSACSRR